MATRSYIGVEAEGIDAVSCFYDGYPQGPYGVGSVLFEHYPSAPGCGNWSTRGNVACLGPVIGSKVEPDHYLRNHGYEKQALFCMRETGSFL